MPFRTIPGTGTKYGLLCYDAKGIERQDGAMSRELLEAATIEDITNIFLFSHGWMGDVPAAIDQYDRWIRAFDTLEAGRQRAASVFPGFRPLYIGLHWPSLPWGDEEVGDGSFAPGEEAPGPEALYSAYLERLGDTPEIRGPLRAIIEEARRNATADNLSVGARDALLELNDALGLGSDGVTGAPDADREPFDPDAAFEQGAAAFGGFDVFGGILGLLRLCSYWTMKKRARTLGEICMHAYLNRLMEITASRGTRVHLMGHSFGCVVISSILGGPAGKGPLQRPVDSVALVQGAVSLWSYGTAIPFGGSEPGYFHRVLPGGKVRGPLITTQSRFDTAVGQLYPRASAVSGEISFAADELPKYGAIGTFGLQGLSQSVRTDAALLPAGGEYGFEKGRVYNLEGSRFIAQGTGSSGAHNDIAGAEVAHAIWEAAFAAAC